MGKVLDLTGQRYGRLVATGTSGKRKHGRAVWECVCDCGQRCETVSSFLLRGLKRSCGCLQLEAFKANGARNRTHGLADSPTSSVYRAMMDRCYRPDTNGYERYGGAGVTVCERWHKFANFVEDMGARPPGRTIDRIDNNKGYEPGNCRWATPTEQNRNRSVSLLLTVGAETKCLAAWAEQFAIGRTVITSRIRRGWSIEAAVKTPIRPFAKRGTYSMAEKTARFLDENGFPVKESNE